MPLEKVEGIRHYEKLCLPEFAPIDCGEEKFFREQQYTLIGFARNVTVEASLEDCVAACIKDQSCKSAMYFYVEGECITNSANSKEEPQVFVPEQKDKVVYFENGCLKKSSPVKVAQRNEAVVKNEKKELAVSKLVKKIEVNAEKNKTEEDVSKGFGPWGNWSYCDHREGRRIRHRECLWANSSCIGRAVEVQWCNELGPSELRIRPFVLKASNASSDEEVAPPIPIPIPTRSTQGPIIVAPPRFLGSVSADHGWGPWELFCRPFGENQPCNGGSRIGFQSRQCVAADPVECRGPLFRYCFIPC
jgi:hypothetical protein